MYDMPTTYPDDPFLTAPPSWRAFEEGWPTMMHNRC
jgi:hypothetical protein